MTLEPRTRSVASERGAILIQTGVLLLTVSAFAIFVVDYGVLWVSRNQAQNAADAGALAGAAALAFDDFDDRADDGPAKLAAHRFARANVVFGEQPDVNISTDVRFYSDAPADFPAMCSGNDCIRVDVYRNQARGNALPTFFGWLVGVNDQGVRATAIAQAAAGNATKCLKPWAVLDKWSDSSGPWTSTSDFDPAVDTYTPPDGDDPGTSYTLASDLGLELKLKLGNPSDSKEVFGAGWFSPVQLGGTGGDDYRDAISGCADGIYKIGDTLGVENGNMVGPTAQGVGDLYDLDPTADWDPVEKKVINSCVGPPYTCSVPGYQSSPRIVALPVVNTAMAYDEVHTDAGGTKGAGDMTVKIVAILGFFVKGMDGKDVVGYLATKPDLLISNGGAPSPAAAFLMSVRLVR
jgi:Flp pilus assembly protein TadG